MYQRILVPIDGSAAANKGLDEAIALARLTGARLRLLHVVEEMISTAGFEGYAAYAGDLIDALTQEGERVLKEGEARVTAAGLVVDSLLTHTVAQRVADLVIDQALAWKAELLVIGTHGRRGVRRLLLGSDAEQIVRMSPVPVLLVRAPAPA